MVNPVEGYSIILGVNAPLIRMLPLQLQLFEKQNLHHLHDLIIVIDTPAARLDFDVETTMRLQFPMLPLRFEFYDAMSWQRLRKIGWSKCYSWHSWSRGLGLVRSRYAVLHDYDAFIMDDDFLEERYAVIQQQGSNFVGFQSRRYEAWEPDGPTFAGTWEMIFDAARVRQACQPIQLFNRYVRRRGCLAMLDTFHEAQYRLGGVGQSVGTASQLAHASQMICQVTNLGFTRRHRVTAPMNMNLLLTPYLLQYDLDPFSAALDTDQDLTLFGHALDIRHLTWQRAGGLHNIICQIERKLHGEVRPHAKRYVKALMQRGERQDRLRIARDLKAPPSSAAHAIDAADHATPGKAA